VSGALVSLHPPTPVVRRAFAQALASTEPVSSRRVVILTNLDNKEEVVYSLDPRMALDTDTDVANLWSQVPVRPSPTLLLLSSLLTALRRAHR